jgi:hypothetical protein
MLWRWPGQAMVKYDLPCQNAGFILGRLLGEKATDFTVSVDRKGELMTIARACATERGKPASGTGASCHLSVKACNPQYP